jgi:hypothetical protein
VVLEVFPHLRFIFVDIFKIRSADNHKVPFGLSFWEIIVHATTQIGEDDGKDNHVLG